MSVATLLSPVDLLDLHTRQRQTIYDSVSTQALSAFDLLPGFDAGAEVDKFLEQLFPVVEAGQQLTGLVTSNHVANVVSSLTGAPPALTQGAALGVELLRGTSFFTVYRRPIILGLSLVAAGATTVVATKVARDRLARLVDDDLSLAHRKAALTAFAQDDRITGYRRVVRPEGQKVCGLCVAASDKRYTREELMPLHTRCRCGVMPIVRTGRGRVKDPGRSINGQDIGALYAATTETAGSTSRQDIAEVRFSVHEHGELGPVLRKAGDHFTGPAEVAAAETAA